jgi:hypothetical protein
MCLCALSLYLQTLRRLDYSNSKPLIETWVDTPFGINALNLIKTQLKDRLDTATPPAPQAAPAGAAPPSSPPEATVVDTPASTSTAEPAAAPVPPLVVAPTLLAAPAPLDVAPAAAPAAQHAPHSPVAAAGPGTLPTPLRSLPLAEALKLEAPASKAPTAPLSPPPLAAAASPAAVSSSPGKLQPKGLSQAESESAAAGKLSMGEIKVVPPSSSTRSHIHAPRRRTPLWQCWRRQAQHTLTAHAAGLQYSKAPLKAPCGTSSTASHLPSSAGNES